MRILITALFISLISFSIEAQDFFQVELEKRSPSVQDLVRSYEGFPVIPFMANDMNGNQQNLAALSGEKHTILFFWNLECPKCLEQITPLNLLKEKHSTKLDIISLSNNDKSAMFKFSKTTPINFPIIPNSKTLSEGPYLGDLGYPKIFIIDDFGIIRWVFGQDSFDGGMDTYKVLETLVTQLEQEGK